MTVLIAEEEPGPQAATPQQRCLAALDSGADRSDLAFTVIRASDPIRIDVEVSIPASSVSLTKVGDGSEAFLTWFIVQRDPSGKRFGERWTGDIHLTLVLPEALEHFRENGVRISQRLVSSDNALLQITVCDTQSGMVGSQTIPAYEPRSAN